MKQDIYTAVKEYVPFNRQEAKDRELILQLLESEEDLFTRNNSKYHMTASGWVVNKERDKVLMAYHKIYDSWAWLGGHADGERDLLKVAVKEVEEESGLKNVQPVGDSIFSLEILTVDGHVKNGEYVSSHLHLNITYLFQGDEEQPLTVNPAENSGVKWFYTEDALKASSERWFVENVYSKLILKAAKDIPEHI